MSQPNAEKENRLGVILAGGAGKRFWPLSTQNYPKPFLKLFGPETLLKQTVARIRPLVGDENIMLVAGKNLEKLFSKCHPDLLSKCVWEPIARNTLGAVLLVCARMVWQERNPILGIFPADHYIPDSDAFRQKAEQAYRLASKGYIVTLGVLPTRPDTGYGYIQRAARCPHAELAYTVKKFLEKPDKETAEKLLAGKDVYWNSGMFFFRVSTFIQQLRNVSQRLTEVLEALAKALSHKLEGKRLTTIFSTIPDLNIDKAVMEKVTNMVVIPFESSWSDVGKWDSLLDLKAADKPDFISGEVVAKETANNVLVVAEDGVPIYAFGVRGLVAVSTRNAILLCPTGMGERLKEFLKQVRISS